MKNLLFATFVFLNLTGFSQNENPANYFYTQLLGESVVLNFELRQGAVCFGIQIQRRDEFSEFEQIGVISGICGSEDSPESYVYVDEQPLKNQRSFYRLIFNGIGQSHEVEVFVPDFSQRPYVVAIEPNSQQWAIFFRNPLEQNIQLNLYALSGVKLHASAGQSNFMLLPSELWREKILVFMLFSDDGEFFISGKVLFP
jgi:hypothetical protein